MAASSLGTRRGSRSAKSGGRSRRIARRIPRRVRSLLLGPVRVLRPVLRLLPRLPLLVGRLRAVVALVLGAAALRGRGLLLLPLPLLPLRHLPMLAREALVQLGLAPRLPDLPTMLLLHPLPLPGLPALEVLASPLLLPVLAELAPLRLPLLGLALLLEAPVLLRLLRPVAGLPALEVLVHAFLLLTLAGQATLPLSRLAALLPFPHLGRGGPGPAGRHRVGAGENAGLEHGHRAALHAASAGRPDRVHLDHAVAGHAPADGPFDAVDVQAAVHHPALDDAVVRHVPRDADEIAVAVGWKQVAMDPRLHEDALLTKSVVARLDQRVDLRGAEAESNPRAPGDSRRKRGPADVSAPGSPRHPSGSPLVAWHPDPIVGRVPVPTAVVEDDPTEVLVGQPEPAVIIGPDPVADRVGAPAMMDPGHPGPAVLPDVDPAPIGRQIFVEKADVHFNGRAMVGPRGYAAAEPQRESKAHQKRPQGAVPAHARPPFPFPCRDEAGRRPGRRGRRKGLLPDVKADFVPGVHSAHARFVERRLAAPPSLGGPVAAGPAVLRARRATRARGGAPRPAPPPRRRPGTRGRGRRDRPPGGAGSPGGRPRRPRGAGAPALARPRPQRHRGGGPHQPGPGSPLARRRRSRGRDRLLLLEPRVRPRGG